MGARNVFRLLTRALKDGEQFDLASGDILKLLPEVDNQGAINIGDGTTDVDLKVFLGASTDFVLMDVSAGRVELDGAELRMGDSDKTEWGDSADVTMAWDATDFDVLPAADDSVFKFGNGTLSFDVWTYGNIASSYSLWDASASTLSLEGAARTSKFNTLSPRFELKKVFGQRGKPGINADIQNAAESTRMVTDPDFEVLGTNASSDDVTYNAEGGIQLETDAADGAEVILAPHLDANQTAWEQVTWGTDQEVIWEAHIKSGANITNAIFWAGLKLTNTEVKATDDNQVYFRFEDDVAAGNLEVVSSVSDVDTSTDTGVVVAVNTEYHLKIVIKADRTAECYVNGVLEHTTGALTNAIDLKPYIGVAADGASAAKALIVFGQAISRKYA